MQRQGVDMRKSIAEEVVIGKSARQQNLGHPLSGSSAKNGHPLSDKEVRRQTADATRRAVYGISPHVAGDLGIDVSLIHKWTAGERRSPVESVHIATGRSLSEGKGSRENSVAMVSWLAEVHLTPDELEDLAARKRSAQEGPAESLRRSVRAIQSASDDYLAGRINGHEAYELSREQRRASEAIATMGGILDAARARAWSVEQPAQDRAKVEAPSLESRGLEERS